MRTFHWIEIDPMKLTGRLKRNSWDNPLSFISVCNVIILNIVVFFLIRHFIHSKDSGSSVLKINFLIILLLLLNSWLKTLKHSLWKCSAV